MTDKDKRAEHDNPGQDPDHPSNKTLAKDPRAPGPDHIAGPVYSSDNLRTEQEKTAGDDSRGIGPLSKSEHSPGPVETIEDINIGPRTPYPTGDPPPPAESVSRSQGIKGVTDKPEVKPSETKGPIGTARKEPAR